MTATHASVTWPQALSWRLRRQLLDPVGPVSAGSASAGSVSAGSVSAGAASAGAASAGSVVRRLGAVLSMDESLADLAVGSRRRTGHPGDLASALDDGSVVKVFAFRGSVHYLSPEDGGTYLALRCAGRQWELPSWVEYYRLAPEDWPDFRATVRAALDDGPLTLPELGEAITSVKAYRHLRTVFEDGAGTLVKPLTWQGDMGFGPRRDGRATFQRLDSNPHWRGIPELEDAGPRAVLAYLRTYGPATPDHVHYWLGEGLSAGRKRLDRWWAGLGDQLVAVDVEGTTAYVVRQDVEPLLQAHPSEAVRLLPGHDQWVMGPGTKDVHVTPPARREAVTRKANPVVVGGVVRGTWTRKDDDVTVHWLDDAPCPDVEVELEVARLGTYLGRDLRLVQGS